MRLRSLHHKRPSRYAEHWAQLYTKLQAHVKHSFHISAFSVKNKIDDGWLAEREDPKKLKESLINIVRIVNGRCNKSWCFCPNERRKYN